MFSWLRRLRNTIEEIEVEAEGLIRDPGFGAYSAARRREREASSDAFAKDWDRAAVAIAHKTGKRVGLDTSTRMAVNADFSAGPEVGDMRTTLNSSKPWPLDELKGLIER
jgi:hypothetical protein